MGEEVTGYVRLALAILMQAVRDACAREVTRNTSSTRPTAADVRDAWDFLVSPAALQLVALLGLPRDHYLCRLMETLRGQEQRDGDAWVGIREAARRMGRHPEHVRRLIRAGRLRARRGQDGRWRIHLSTVAAYEPIRERRARRGGV